MTYDKRQATEEFIRWSESYDRSILQWLLFGPSHRAIIKRIGDRPSDRTGDCSLRILDVGCGTGVFAARIREAFPKATIWGLDLVSSMLTQGAARWRHHAGHVLPVQGDSEQLPFAAGTFDVVTCANSFHHYPHQDRAVAEMHRVLKPGGRLCWSTAIATPPGAGSSTTSASRRSRGRFIMPLGAGFVPCSPTPGSPRRPRRSTVGPPRSC